MERPCVLLYSSFSAPQEHELAPPSPPVLIVNLLGCFLLGGIAQFGLTHLSLPPEWRIGITVGFLGAFTTFSTFSWETVQMLRDGEWLWAGFYVGASLLGGLLAVLFGIRLAKMI
jgi:CrcB protein